MIVKFRRKDGTEVAFELGDKAIAIGRSPEADLVLLDDKVSRLHCGIRYWDGEYILKDLHSKNGTYVNGRRVELCKLNPGDQIRVGSCVFTVEGEAGKGTETILRELAEEFAEGKGYSTILKELVETTAPANKPAVDEVVDEALAAMPPRTPEKPPETLASSPPKRVIRIRTTPKKDK